MGPIRKRPRTNTPKDEDRKNSPSKSQTTGGEVEQLASTIPLPQTPLNEPDQTRMGDLSESQGDRQTAMVKKVSVQQDSSHANTDKEPKPSTKSSWYGTWPRKSTASTHVARETIIADQVSAGSSDSHQTPRDEQRKSASQVSQPASMRLGKGKETLDVTMSDTLDNENPSAKNISQNGASKSKHSTFNPSIGGDRSGTSVPTPDNAQDLQAKAESQEANSAGVSASVAEQQRPGTSSGWLSGWLSKPVQPIDEVNEHHKSSMQVEEVLGVVSSVTDTQSTTDAVPSGNLTEGAPSNSSWFGLWSKAPAPNAAKPTEQLPIPAVLSNSTGQEEQVASDTLTPPVDKSTSAITGGSSWAFWSTDNKKSPNPVATQDESRGELAVSGKPSETKPEPAKATNLNDPSKPTSSKRGRLSEVEIVDGPKIISQPGANQSKTSLLQSSPSTKPQPPNLLLPTVKNTYRLIENPSILQQLARLLLKGKQMPVKHVFLSKEKNKIKHALAIGIHGLFPAPLLRTVIGQPTGTSIKFANHAADAIRRWADTHGSMDCEIEKVALEGEGKIADRVDNLWKLLLNWIDHVRKADFILIGCHSQGVPVAVMLVAKLIEFGVVSSSRIGICAMAGVSLGPFADYKSRLFSGSAGELFDFANPESTVSKRYEDSLKACLKYGTRITYCGSIDDQLVSMESSIFATVSHPYIFRAVFVDGRIHAPDFLSHLVGFALKLRNLGVSDHGLIRELSAPLAGSLYTGEGHSRLYDDGNVYDLATEFALGTTSVGDIPLQVQKYEILSNANPYVLPWIMRGLLEEDFVKTELDAETAELLKQFDDWKPSTKVLKDVKYRLEAVRSKL